MIIPASWLISTAGCADSSADIDYVALDGTFEKVHAEAGVVTFQFTTEAGTTHRERAMVPQECEIWIDGSLASLGDVNPGEAVRVVWRIEKFPGYAQYTALKVVVSRSGGPAARLAPRSGGSVSHSRTE